MICLTFSDSEKDICEILDESTFEASLSEFPSTITYQISIRQEKLLSTQHPSSQAVTYFSQSESPAHSISQNSLISFQRQSLKFFKPRSHRMAVFDLESEKITWVEFSPRVSFKEYAAWVELPSGEIFYCGGGNPTPSNEVYLLNPYVQTVKMLPNMMIGRHSHGLTYSNGSVYVLGGFKQKANQTSMVKECEKYDVINERWENIFDLEVERGDTAAFAVNDSILVFGKGSSHLVMHNSGDFKIDLLKDEGGCMCLVDRNLYVFQADKVKVCDLNYRQIIEEHQLPKKKSWWSHCPPIVFKDFIYFVWWEDPGWICRYNLNTKEFINLISL